MSSIFVCPLFALDETLKVSAAQTMIAFGGPEAEFRRPSQVENYFTLRFNDIAEARDGLQEPTREHVAQIISIADEWRRETPLLLQCWMGVSRSTAAAAIVAARLRPDIAADTIANALRKASPIATPNPLMIQHADTLLRLGGKFCVAVAAIGRGKTASQGVPFSLELDNL